MSNNIVIFLNGQRGVVILESLLQAGRSIVAVVAPEESCFWEISIKYADQNLIKTTQVNHPDIIQRLSDLTPDVFIVAGFPMIFKKPLLSVPKRGVFNLHGGPLPKYRGGSPLNWQIINGETEIGVSVISMDAGIDTGDILAQDFFELTVFDDIHTVHQKANTCFSKLILDVLTKMDNNQLESKKQNAYEAQYWLQRSSKEGRIDWKNMTAKQVVNLIRALKPPYPSAFTFTDAQKIFLYEAIVPDKIIKGTPGRVAYLQTLGPYIVCKDHAILVTQSSGKLKNGALLDAD